MYTKGQHFISCSFAASPFHMGAFIFCVEMADNCEWLFSVHRCGNSLQGRKHLWEQPLLKA